MKGSVGLASLRQGLIEPYADTLRSTSYTPGMPDYLPIIRGEVDHRLAPQEGEILGLLATVEAHAGDRGVMFGLGLLRGWSRTMAAVPTGVSETSIRRWEERHYELGEAFERLEQIGFAVTMERELYERAMAGPDDRSSARLLEIVVKARDPKYRDKAQIDITHSVASRKAMTSLTAGWQDGPGGAENAE
jgi:hypothetical protein